MVAVAHEQAEFEQLEGLKCVEDGVYELGVNVLELGDLWSVKFILGVLVRNCNKGLVSLELFEELPNRRVYDADYRDYFPHDLVLDEDVAFGLDNLCTEVILALIFRGRVFRLHPLYLRNGVLDPQVLRVNHGFNAL